MQKLDLLPESDVQLVEIAVGELKDKNSEPLQTVVAAAKTESGEIRTAINLYHFTGGPCAEGVLLANNLFRQDPFVSIVAVHYNDNNIAEIINPCGRCRQMFNDYTSEVKVIVDDRSEAKSVTVPELLPYSYRNKATEYKRSVKEGEL